MPKIPSYKSQTEIQVPNLPNVSPQVNTAPGQGLVQEIENIEDVMVKVRDFRQVNEADIFASEGINDILLRAERDDSLDPTKYEAEIDQLGSTASGVISGTLAKEQFMNNFRLKGLDARNKIKHNYYQKELDTAKAVVGLKAQSLVDNPDDEQAQINFAKSLEHGIAINLYTPAEANAIKDKTMRDVRKAKVTNDILSDDSRFEDESEVLKQLRLGEKGEYGDLTLTERLELIKDSQSRIYSNNQTFKREVDKSQQQKLYEITYKLISGDLTLSYLEKEANISPDEGGLNPQTINSLREGLMRQVEHNLKNVVEDDKKAAKFNNFFRNYIDNKIDREKALELLSRAYSDGQLSRQEAEQLIKLKAYTEDVAFAKSVERSGASFAKVLDFLGAEPKDEKEVALKIKQYLNEVNNVQDIDVATNDFIEKERRLKRLKANPDIGNYPKEGQLLKFNDGIIRRVFPDGRVEEQ